MIKFIVFLLVGKLVIYILQKFPFRDTFIGNLFSEGKFLEKLFSCDLCLGVWVYATLGYIFRFSFIGSVFGTYVLFIDEAITGMIASFLMHIFSIGWNTKFGTVLLE